MPARDRFVAEMGSALNDAGLPPLPARVFSALLVEDDGRLTSAQLAAGLGVSPAGISGAVRYLEQVRMIHRSRVPGTRADLYVVDDDAWHSAMLSTQTLYEPMVAALERGIAGLADGVPARHRLQLTREFLLFITDELGAVTRRWERRKRALLRDLLRDLD